MNFKNEKQNELFRKVMFYSEAVAFLMDLENMQKARAAKLRTTIKLLELEVPKGTVKKGSFQTVTILELFSNHMLFGRCKEASP